MKELHRGLYILGLVVALGLLVVCSQGITISAGPTRTAHTVTAAATRTSTEPANSAEDFILIAQNFVNNMAKGDYAAVAVRLDETMKTSFPEAVMKDTWAQLTAQVGDFQKQTDARLEEQQGYQLVFVTCQFEKALLDAKVVFNPQGQISGLFFDQAQAAQATQPLAYHPPAYVETRSFQEVEVTIGSGGWALRGTLTLPNGEGPFPAVTLVHGSGPNDRDESLGPNKPFCDLAWGLASQGIAVLRYDKRTWFHANRFSPEVIATLTVQEETIQDALLAVQLLKRTEGIDPQRIFVLGHSLGGMLAPRMALQDPTLAGLIILAGPNRGLEDLAVDQYTFIYSLDGILNEQEKADLESVKAQAARVKDPDLSDDLESEDYPLGISPAYWRDLRGYQPAEIASTLTIPMFVLQGGRDYQISPTKDFEGWKATLEGKGNATLKLYPDLNHLFMAGEGLSTPQEYEKEGHVSPEVIGDIAGWVKK